MPIDQLVPGDIVELIAGDLVPADSRLLESRDLFINQALLTGEPYPAEKQASDEALGTENPAGASNTVFAGTSVISGTATIVICQTGGKTALGHLAASLAEKPPATAFAVGIRHFGMLIMRLTVLMVLFVLVVNISFVRPNRIPKGPARPAAHQAAGLPTPPPTPAPSASATDEPDDQQQYQRADGGVDNRRNNAQAKMDAKLRKQPSTDEGADDSNQDIADDPKPGASHDLTGQPSSDEADH